MSREIASQAASTSLGCGEQFLRLRKCPRPNQRGSNQSPRSDAVAYDAPLPAGYTIGGHYPPKLRN